VLFDIDLQSGKPIYQQLVDQVKLAVATGRLREGDKLPSIRDVAVSLRINRNTVARVYTELEREGVLVTRQGQGCFVGGRGSGLSAEVQNEELIAKLDEVIAQARLFSYPERKIRELFEARLARIFHDDSDKEERSS
jgi:GntR family transcriptional regulator